MKPKKGKKKEKPLVIKEPGGTRKVKYKPRPVDIEVEQALNIKGNKPKVLVDGETGKAFVKVGPEYIYIKNVIASETTAERVKETRRQEEKIKKTLYDYLEEEKKKWKEMKEKKQQEALKKKAEEWTNEMKRLEAEVYKMQGEKELLKLKLDFARHPREYAKALKYKYPSTFFIVRGLQKMLYWTGILAELPSPLFLPSGWTAKFKKMKEEKPQYLMTGKELEAMVKETESNLEKAREKIEKYGSRPESYFK